MRKKSAETVEAEERAEARAVGFLFFQIFALNKSSHFLLEFQEILSKAIDFRLIFEKLES